MDITNIILEEYNKLGEGGFGKVFERDGFAFKVTSDDVEASFAIKLKYYQDKLISFPKIYSVNITNNKKYYIIKRELVSMLKPTEKALVSANNYKIHKYVNFGDEESLKFIENSKLNKKFIDFLITLRKEYMFLGRKKDNLDIHSGNIGFNSNGDYVLFDF